MTLRRSLLAAATLAGLLGASALAPARAESYALRFSTSQVNPNEPEV
ncbi:MAG TPA: hypothetical protein VGF26_09420 [Ramlibacter sp.]